MSKAKPFIKWVGGKGQLIAQLDAQLPVDFADWNNVTYIEPFVGGGAMLFYMLQHYPNIKHAVINDINPDLITCYKTVRDNPKQLIESLRHIEILIYLYRLRMKEKNSLWAFVPNTMRKNLIRLKTQPYFFS